MEYLFRDDAYKGITIRFIKALNFDSDGYVIAPVDLFAVRKKLKTDNPNLRIIIMLGNSDTSYTADDFMGMFLRDNPRKRDQYYEWTEGTTEI